VIILGIETSCDDTGVAVYDGNAGLLSHVLYSQVEPALYGGVVPELASRDHLRKITPLIEECLKRAGISRNEIDGVAYTAGPGLIGALLVGAVYGRSLAWALEIPSLAVHHMEAHLLAPLLETHAPEFPFLALLVSGGHTMLVEVSGLGQYQILGETLDDAVGEAFDKTAKLLGLEYPGGPKLARLAEQGHHGKFKFPRPMVNRPGLDFSFSGLKTHTLTTWQRSDQSDQTRADIALEFQSAVVDTLRIKCHRAMEQTGLRRLVIAGGVGANLALRSALHHLVKDLEGELFFPRIEFCTDNGAMVAFCGYLHLAQGERDGSEFIVRPRWELTSSQSG